MRHTRTQTLTGPTTFVKRALVHPPVTPGFPGQIAQPTTQAAPKSPSGQNGPGRPAGSSSSPSSPSMGSSQSSTGQNGMAPMMPAQPIAATVPPKPPEKGFGNDVAPMGSAKAAALSGSQLAEYLGAITAGQRPTYVPRNKTASGLAGQALGGLGGGVLGAGLGGITGAGLGALLGRYASDGLPVSPEASAELDAMGVDPAQVASASRTGAGLLGGAAGGLAGVVGGGGLGALLGIHATRERKPKDEPDMARKDKDDDKG